MRLATEPFAPKQSPIGHRSRAWIGSWNRRLHFYVGLFLLFFVWLFAVSGLVLNHPEWNFAESWDNRRETNHVSAIMGFAPEIKGDLAEAHDIMRQTGIEGEILWTTTRANPDLFEFQVRRPGRFFFIKADLEKRLVSVRESTVNVWGVIKVLHVFTGVQQDDPRQSRDWALTTVWAYSMDAVAAGLIFMVLSSLYMWWELPRKRVAGAVALALGTILCGLFCLGLRWFF